MQSMYPWDKWFAHNEITIYRNKDYKVSQSSMQQMIRNNAYLRGLRVSIKDIDNGLIIRVVGKTDRYKHETKEAGSDISIGGNSLSKTARLEGCAF